MSGLTMKSPTFGKKTERPKNKRRLELPDVIKKEENGVKMLRTTSQLTVRYTLFFNYFSSSIL